MDIDFSQVITQILAFMVMLWVLTKFGWDPLRNLLDERKAFIESEFKAIEDEKQHALNLSAVYDEKLKMVDHEGRQKIQEAISHGRKMAEEIEHNAHENAREIVEKAHSEVKLQMAQAKGKLKSDFANLIVMTTEKILDQKLDKSEQDRLVDDFVEEVNL